MNSKKLTLNEEVQWNADGLVCAIAQDKHTQRVLMVAWMNSEALEKTLESGFAHYYSRSRQKQWKKGESSGHTQKVHAVHLDCDGDAVLLTIEQHGGIACHTGRESCFYRIWQEGQWHIQDPILKSEEDIYGKPKAHS